MAMLAPCRPASRWIVERVLVAALLWVLLAFAAPAREDGMLLHLDVVINGRQTGLIGAFRLGHDGELFAQRRELTELGLESGRGDPLEWVAMGRDSAFRATYLAQSQRIEITVRDSALTPRRMDLRDTMSNDAPAPVPLGAFVNYRLFGIADRTGPSGRSLGATASATLDGRLFSQWGSLEQTALVGLGGQGGALSTRLSTTYLYSDRDRATNWRAGDIVTRTPIWTRPLRLGGVQIERDFGMRSDIVTTALPALRGTAAVPSTVDVFVDNIRMSSRPVEAGPFEIANIPVVSGTGSTRLVIRDPSGREVATTGDFIASARLLRPGIFDYSIEAGVPRTGYGSESFGYEKTFVGSASGRYGFAPRLTVETHLEGGSGLLNGGIGTAVGLPRIGVLSLAGSASATSSGKGAQVHASLESTFRDINWSFSLQRSFGTFLDLAAVTTTSAPLPGGVSGASTPLDPAQFSGRRTASLQRLVAGAPVPLLSGSLGLSVTRAAYADGAKARIVTLSYSRTLLHDASLHVAAYGDFGDVRSQGAFAGLSIPFGKTRVSSNVTRNGGSMRATLEAGQDLGQDVGSYGWRVQAAQGGGQSLQSVGAAYRTSVGRGDLTLARARDQFAARGEVEGSLVALREGIFATQRIDDAFAIVDVAAADVPILHQNRVVGRSNRDGKLVLPGINGNAPNTIAIDPTDLTLSAEVSRTSAKVVVARGTGLGVTMKIRAQTSSAEVIFVAPSGAPLPPGSTGRLAGSDTDFIIGYDGRAYLEGMTPRNDVEIALAGTTCRASFGHEARADRKTLGPVVCR